MEADVAGLIGAGRHERSADRLNYRKGYRDRSLETRLGTLYQYSGQIMRVLFTAQDSQTIREAFAGAKPTRNTLDFTPLLSRDGRPTRSITCR